MFNKLHYISIWFLGLITIIFCNIAFAENINTNTFIEMLRERVQLRYAVPPQDVIIIYKDVDLEEKLKIINSDNIELKIKDSTLSMIAGKESLPVDVYIDGKYKTVILLKVKVEVFKDVFVTNRAITKGEIFSQENIKKERKFISSLPNNIMYNADNIYGTSALRNLPVNTVILSSMLKAIPVILRGHKVILKVKNRNLTLISEGEALEDGYMGGIIKIKVTTLNIKKIIYAKVVGLDEVEIDLE